MTLNVLALSGSLRQASFNTALLRTALELAPAGMQLDLRTLHGIPLYDGDLEAEGLPEAVRTLGEAISKADALLICTPEYNHSIPGVLKNGLDWMSRPSGAGARIFGGKPTAVMGATPGGGGTMRSQDALLHVLRAFGSTLWFGPWMTVSQAHKLVDEQGRIGDEKARAQLGQFLAGFATFIGEQQKAKA